MFVILKIFKQIVLSFSFHKPQNNRKGKHKVDKRAQKYGQNNVCYYAKISALQKGMHGKVHGGGGNKQQQ